MIYYVGYYNCDLIRDEERAVSPASENKMSYIISALSEAVEDNIQVVSPAETRKHKLIKGKFTKILDRVTLKTFSSFSSNNRLARGLGHFLTRISFFSYLLMNVNSEDSLIVYHSLVYMDIIKLVKKIKKCELIIEVEELYSDVKEDEYLRKREIGYLQISDKYIFITNLLRKEIDEQKPFIISHGTYRSISDFGFRFNDNKIHVVYAGTFDPVKGGVFAAISIAEYLDDNFVVDILGTGSASEVQAVKRKIKEVSPKTTCKVNYVGYKFGDEFDSYVQACQIGLATQQFGAKFNATSFPSKILMYMSNGIRVVCARISAVETSDVSDFVNYYDSPDAKEIAKAVRNASLDKSDGRRVLNRLHNRFLICLKELIYR